MSRLVQRRIGPSAAHSRPAVLGGKLRFAGLLVLGMTLAACDRPDDAATAPLRAAHFVPADTVVFGGSLEPVPMTDVSAMLNAFQVKYEPGWIDSVNDRLREAPPGIRMLGAIYLDFLRNMETAQQFHQQIGVGENQDIAIYTIGLIPVLRYRLDDTAAFDSWLQGIEKSAGVTAERTSIEGVAVRRYPVSSSKDSNGMSVLIGHHLDFAVITLDAESLQDATLKLALGVERPQQSLADSGKLEQLVEQHRLASSYLGFIDFEQIALGITTDDANLLARMMGDMFADQGSRPAQDSTAIDALHSEACQRELGALAARWPRLSMGYKELQVETKPMVVDVQFVIESTDVDFMAELRTLRGVLPSFSRSQDYRPILDVALGLDLQALGPFVSKLRQSLIDADYQCAPLTEIGAAAGRTSPFAIAMFSAFAAGLQGIGVSLLDVDRDESAAAMPRIGELDGVLAISAADPTKSYQAAAAMLPLLANTPVPGKGEIVELPISMPGDIRNPKLRLTDHQILLFSGEKSEQLARTLPNELSQADGFMSLQMDYRQYYRLWLDVIRSTPKYAELDEQERALMQRLANLDATMTMTVDLIDQGISFGSRIEVR